MEKGLSDAPVRYVTLDDAETKPAAKDQREPREIVRPKGYAEFVAKNRQPEPKPPKPTLGQRIATNVKDAASSVGAGLSDAAGWVSDTAKQLTTPTAAPDQHAATPEDGAFADPMGSGVGASIMQQATPEQPSFIDQASQPQPGFKPSQADLVEQSKTTAARLKEANDQRITDSRLNAPTLKAAPELSGVQRALNSTVRKPLDNSAIGAAVENAGDIARGIAQAPESLAKSAWGGVQMAADLAGADSLSELAARAVKAGERKVGQYSNPNGDHLLTGAVGSLTTAILGGAAGGSHGAVALIVGQTSGDKYAELRQAKVDPKDAAPLSVAYGIAEFLGERIGVPSLGRMFSGMAKRDGMAAISFLKEAVKQQGEEQATQAMQSFFDKFGEGSPGKNMTFDDYLDQVVETAKQTAIMSGLTGAGGVARRAGRVAAQHLRPTELRTDALKRFDDLAAEHGLPDDALKAAKDAVAGKPLDQVPAILKRITAAMSRNGLFGKPVAEEALASLDHPEDGPVDASEVLGAVQPAKAYAQDAVQSPVQSPATEAAQEAPKPTPSVEQSAQPSPTAAAIDEAAHGAATSPLNDKPQPTDAQKEAGNYAKGHVTVQGLDIAVENPRGSTRSGTSPEGVKWETTMQHHYGYIKGTVGNDKDHVDTFIGQNPESPRAFVVDQIDPKTGEFDEHKVVLGADSLDQAREIYQSNYEKGWKGLGAITELPMSAFKSWVKDGAKRAPLGDISTKQQEAARNEQIGQNPHDQAAQQQASQAPAGEEGDGAPGAPGQEQGQPAQPAAEQGGSSGLKPGTIRAGKVGGKYSAGEVLSTSSGRETSPFPKIDTSTNGKANNTFKRVDQWLMQNALDEAKARGDDFNARQFASSPSKPTQSDKDSAEEYLFGDQPAVVPSILKPLSGPSSQANQDKADATPSKIFKTRKAAEAHRDSLGNGLRLQKVKGGYKLRAKTDAELAAESKGAQRLKKGAPTNVQGDSLLTAIAKAGGLAMSEKANTINEGNKNAGGKMVFKNDGQPLDIMAQTLAEDGYIPPNEMESDGGVSWLQNAISEEFGGHAQHFSHSGEEWMRKRAEVERGDAPDYDAAGAPDSLLDATGYFDDNAAEQAARDALADANTEASEGAYLEAEDLFWQSLSEVEAQEEEHARQEADQADAQDAARHGSTESPAAGKPQEGDRAAPGDAGQGNAGQPAGKGRGTPVQGKAQEGLTAGTTPKNGKAKPGERLKRVESYFTPGNIVQGYGGFDRVISFKWDEGRPGSFSVTVQHVVKDGDGWKVDPSDARERTHSTQPGERDLKQGAVGQWQDAPILSTQTEEDLRAKAEREDFAKKQESARRAAEQEKVRQADDARDNKARADATVDDFQLGQSADQQMSGMGDLFANGQEVKPSTNTVFTEDAAAKAREILRKKLGGTLNSGIDPELLQAGITLAGYHIEKGARTFSAYAKAMIEDLGNSVAPYLKSWYMGVKYDPRASGFDGMSGAADVEGADIKAITDNSPKDGESDVPSAGADLESDRQNPTSAERVLAQSDGNEPVQSDQGAGQAGEGSGEARGRRGGDAGVRAGGAVAEGERGDQPVSGGATVERPALVPAGADIDQRGGGFGDTGIPAETVSADATRQLAQDGLAQGLSKKAQLKAPTAVKLGDLSNIRETLPMLLPKQQEDALKAETRFAKPDGYGMLFTNGTGTGKTFTGLGLVKRFALLGKTNTIVVVPSDKIMEDWINSGASLGLNITPLSSTQDAGKGIVITTYANFGDNRTLGDRQWDLVVHDEAHYLMQAEDGKTTKSLATLRALTMHPAGASSLHDMRNRVDIDRLKQVNTMLKDIEDNGKASAAYRQEVAARKAEIEAERNKLNTKVNAALDAIKAEVADAQGAGRPRATFLSATPFAYVPTVDWANGYLFDYGEGQTGQNMASGSGQGHSYNSGDWREKFFMQHFGYRMRYNKLTRPDAKVNVALMERQFNAWLRKTGALSGRMLDVEADYDRRFVLVDSAIGSRIDEALKYVSEQGRADKETGREAHTGFQSLGNVLRKKFDYLSRRYLLEAIKAQESIEHVKAHMAMGRKVVVFHDYKKGGGFNPFDISPMSDGGDETVSPEAVGMLNDAIGKFRSEFRDLVRYPFAAMPSPIEAYQKAFPGVLLFNGGVKSTDRRANVAKFQDDATGPAVILVQSAAGKEGISLHDTTGKHQRVLLNLGQPTQPTTAIQQEGRIYRTSQKTDAMFRYFNTGTDWEKWAFATTIATRSSTAENLGMGEQARALKDAFIAAFEESDAYPAGHDGEGKGGKERDKAANEALTEFDRAVSFYFGTQKKNSRTKAQEGADYFATAEPVGLKMVEWADPHAGDDMLEPSGGHGAIARWLPENTERTAIEPSSNLRPRLAMVFDGKIVGSNFEDLHVSNKFDGIVMNPPFGVGGKMAIEHLVKASTHLRDGGRIVALIPTGPAADKRFDKWFYEEDTRPVKPLVEHPTLGPIYAGDTLQTKSAWAASGKVTRKGEAGSYALRLKVDGAQGDTGITLESITKVEPTGKRTQAYRPAEGLSMVANIKLPQVAFERAGTNVATRIVVLERVIDGHQVPAQQNLDWSGIKDINELFDSIRYAELPKRAKPAPVDGEADADQGAEAGKAVARVMSDRKSAAGEKAAKSEEGKKAATASGMAIVEHVTGKGKTLKGVVRKDLTVTQAKEIDAYTFKKDGGWFIRAEHIQKMLDADAEGGMAPSASLSASVGGELSDNDPIGKNRGAASISKVELDSVVDRVAARWKGLTREDVVTIESWAGLPLDVIQYALAHGGVKMLNGIEGLAHKGKVYLVRKAISSREHAEEVLLHEAIGHLGAEAIMGGKSAMKYGALWDQLGGEGGIKKKAMAIELSPGVTVWDRLQPYIEAAKKSPNQNARKSSIANEFIAFAAQQNDAGIISQFKGYLSDLKQGLARFCRLAGLNGIASRLEQMSAIDVAAFVRDARRAIIEGKLPNGGRYVFIRNASSASKAPSLSLNAAPQVPSTRDELDSGLTPSTGPIDTILRRAGGSTLARLTSPAYTRLLDMMDRGMAAVGGRAYDYAKAGLTSDHGLTEPYLDARADMRTAIRQGARETKTVIDSLQDLDRAQSRVAYLWMNEKPDSEQERALLDSLPEESRKVLTDLKERIEELSKEAVRLGLLSQEAYERNSMAYLHRSYQRYEVGDKGAKAIRSRAIKILGDQFKGRGMRDDVAHASIKGPDWWQSKQDEGGADTSLKGQKFRRLELRELPDADTGELFEGGKSQQLGRLQAVVYWPAGEAVPSEYSDWRNAGTWEARYFNKPGKVGMWRDFTLDERTRMGEIQEVRYSTAKTMLQMTRDVETARLLDWVARKEAKAMEDQIPDGHTVAPAKDSMLRSYLPTEWVQVPDAAIPGTGGLRRYGNLAGRYVPGPVWNDIRQIASMTDQGDVAKAYADILRMWKISKTALSPTTHMNNVMSNFIFADLHDVQAKHILKAIKTWATHKKDKAAADLIAEYQDNGGDGGKFNDAELREDVMGEMIAELEREVGGNSPTASITAAQVVDLIRHREFRQAFASIGQTKTAGALAAPAKKLMKLYGHEDELFRLAAYIKARDDGLTGRAAGKFAHDSFLNYDINAPWVQAARRSFFPFISFTYRAVPMLARTFADKPWKAGKYALVAGALNAAAYAMMGMGGGDEDKERALLPDEKSGKIWGIFPKLMRMPWNDEHESPVFLDVRRWIPAGDVIDFGQGHTAVPVPSPLMPGGPLVVLGELILNKSSFTGKPITMESDTLAEKYGKVGDYLWKAMAPNVPLPGPGYLIPGIEPGQMQTYAWKALTDAGSGKTDTFGREQSVGQALLSSVGVKVAAYPPDVLMQNRALDTRSNLAEVDRQINAARRQFARGGITEDELQDKITSSTEKRKGYRQGLADKQEAAGMR